MRVRRATRAQVEPKSEDCLYQDIDVSSRVKTNVLVTRGGKLDIKYKVRADGVGRSRRQRVAGT